MTIPVSYGIRNALPCGPFERTHNDPLGWIDERGHVHAGRWHRDKKGGIVWENDDHDLGLHHQFVRK